MIDINKIPEFYQGYVKTLCEETVIENLTETGMEVVELFQTIPESKGEYAYAENKWTIKEVIQHIIDTERVLGYRALRFARNDKTDLSGFDENDYVLASKSNARSLASLIEEFQHVRSATIDMFNSFDSEMVQNTGTANGFPFSVEAVGYIAAGHCLHHTNILKERYLNAD